MFPIGSKMFFSTAIIICADVIWKFVTNLYIEKDNFHFLRVNNLYTKGVFTVLHGNFVDFCFNS